MQQLRDRWAHPTHLILASIGLAAGLDGFNLLPTAMLAYGGGAFLIAYIVAIATAAVPLMALEMGVGLCYQGALPDSLRKIGRGLEWIGWWATAVGGLLMIGRALFLGWALLWTYDALIAFLAAGPLPWAGGFTVATAYADQALGRQACSTPIATMGVIAPVGRVLLASIVGWTLVHLMTRRGIMRLGAVVALLVPIAIALVTILALAMIIQPDAQEGLGRLFTPDWAALAHPGTWIEAYGCAFHALCLGVGAYVAFASFLNRNADVAGSSVVASFGATLIALLIAALSGAALGVIGGAWALPLSMLHADGPVGVLVVLPGAMSALHLPYWFVDLLSLILATAEALLALVGVAGLAMGLSTAMADRTHHELREVAGLVCLAGLAGTIPFATSLGPDAWRILDLVIIPCALAPVIAAQSIGLAWVTNADSLQRHLNAYSVVPVTGPWRVMVAVVVPVVAIAVTTRGVIHLIQSWSTGGGVAPGPAWAIILWGVVPCLLTVAVAGTLILTGRRTA